MSVNSEEASTRVPLLDAAGRRNTISKTVACKKRCCIALFILGVICGIISLLLGSSYGEIQRGIQYYVDSRVHLVPGSTGLKEWGLPKARVLINITMFNLTNKDAFVKGEKPVFTEIGPFIYRENSTRLDWVWNDDHTIIRYNGCVVYTYDKELSKGLDPQENITTLNFPLMGLLSEFEKLQSLASRTNNVIVKELIQDVINGFDEALRQEFKENLFMTRSVDEVVWGYTDPFLLFVKDLKLPIKGLPQDGKFFIMKKSDCHSTNMLYTGKGRSADTARFIMWNGVTGMTGWGSPYANMINGTQGILFHPGVNRKETLHVFVDTLFRSIDLTYHKDVDHFGIKMYQFRMPLELVSHNKSDPGFYMDGPDGVFNLSSFYPLGLPVFFSKPHFLDAPVYLRYVDGLKPNRELHDTYLDVEPITGGVLYAEKRLQINLELKQNSNIKELALLQNITYFPLLWIEEGGQMNSSEAETFKQMVYGPLSAIKDSVFTVISVTGFIGVLSTLLPIFAMCLSLKKKKNN